MRKKHRIVLKVYGVTDPKLEAARQSREPRTVKKPYAAPEIDLSPKEMTTR